MDEGITYTLASVDLQSTTTIYHLPTEILEIIFINNAREYHRTASGDHIPSPPHWVNVSYVSRLWRDVALNCPILWTYLFITSARWTEELLARSRQASLRVTVQLRPNNQSARFLGRVLNHVEQIEELFLHLPLAYSDFGTDKVAKLCSFAAPHLRRLEIEMSSIPPNSPTWLLFGGDTPMLRTLDLSYCPVPWYSFKLSCLTTLSLSRVPLRLRQSTEEFLTTLGGMQNLVYLYLVDALAGAAGFLASAAFDTYQKINLPYLSHLLLDAPLSTVTALLSCVDIPLTTLLRLSYHGETHTEPSRDCYAPLCSVLARRVAMIEDQGLSNLTIRSLAIESKEFGGSSIAFSVLENGRHFRPPLFHDRRWSASVPLTIELSRHLPWPLRDTSSVCCAIPLTNVARLYVINPPHLSAFWRKMLRHLGKIRYLEIRDGYMPALDSVLSLDHRSGMQIKLKNGYANEQIAPFLEELELDDIMFSAADASPGAFADVKSLWDALATRKGPRGRLTMTRCTESIGDGQVNEFSKVGYWEAGRFHVVEDFSRTLGIVEDG